MGNRTKNILRNLGFLLSVPVIICAFVFAATKDNKELVKGFEVVIENPELGFVSQQDIATALMKSNVVLDYSTIDQLDMAKLEDKINSNPWIDNAEVYVTSNQNLKIKLKQVTPLLRVQRTDSTANGYYLDARGFMIPLSRTYYPDLPILTSERPITTIQQRKELVSLAQYIERDTFWQATISQINLDTNNDIELVSLIGDANIRFGTIDNKEDKFFRLFQFYKKGINRINWDNVKELDVRFANQLVCRRYHKEEHIEAFSAPKLYANQKTKPLPLKEPVRFATATAPKKVSTTKKTITESPTKKVVASAPQKIAPVKTETASVKKVETAQVQEKNEAVKPAVIKQTEPERPAIEKPAKKKRKEIIINTEPVTSKNETKE